jgi:hypothetical protein
MSSVEIFTCAKCGGQYFKEAGKEVDVCGYCNPNPLLFPPRSKGFDFKHPLSDDIIKEANGMMDTGIRLVKAEESAWLMELAGKVRSLEAEIERLRQEAV